MWSLRFPSSSKSLKRRGGCLREGEPRDGSGRSHMSCNRRAGHSEACGRLEHDLRMVYTVSLSQGKPLPEKFAKAISKQITNLCAGTLDRITTTEAQMEAEGLVTILPSKGALTLKPPSEPYQKFARQFRFVISGNYALKPRAEEEGMSLYADGPSAETFRVAGRTV